MTENQLRELRGQMMRHFNEDRMILYLGRKAEPSELPERFCRLPWQCVVTSRREDSLPGMFRTDLWDVKTLDGEGAADLQRLNPRDPFLLFLFGSRKKMEPAEEKPTLMKKRTAGAAWRRLLALMCMEPKSHLVIVGYDAEDAWELNAEQFCEAAFRLDGRRIDVFVGGDALSEAMEEARAVFLTERRAGWHACDFLDVLAAGDDEDDEDDEDVAGLRGAVVEDTKTFYAGGKTFFIDADALRRKQSVAKLVTREWVEEFIPYGKRMRQDAFYQFLNESPVEPQWYGFMKQTEFRVPREFSKKTLFPLVEDLLDGRNPAGTGPQLAMPPVILYGATGASKSVELAALAYHVFEQQKHPVVYIKDPDVAFRYGSGALMQLDELLHAVEETMGDAGSRFLVVWDTSAYQDIEKRTDSLQRAFIGDEHACVIVCTAYERPFHEDRKGNRDYIYRALGKEEKSKNGTRFQRIPKKAHLIWKDTTDAIYHDRRFYVCASRRMQSHEKNDLLDRINRYVIEDKKTLSERLDEIEEDDDIFQYIFELILTLRSCLMAGVTREQQMMDRVLLEGWRRDTPERVKRLMENHDVPAVDSGATDDAALAELQGRVRAFMVCVAMFSRFKLPAPYALAFQMFRGGGENSLTYPVEVIQRMEDVVGELSCIRQSVTQQGAQVFAFRLALEAELYLRNHHVRAEEQIEIVEQMLDIYGRRTMDGVADLQVGEAIVDLVRQLGPNSKYREFQENGSGRLDYLKFLRHMDRIVTKLDNVREQIASEAARRQIALLEITISREYYGTRWQEETWPEKDRRELAHYKERLEHLNETGRLIRKMLDQTESPDFSEKENTTVRHNLIEEQTLCNIELGLLIDAVKTRFAAELAEDGSWIDEIVVLPYEEIYRSMVGIIDEEPTNGYYYNALFKAFEHEYARLDEKDSGGEEQLGILGNIQKVADRAMTIGPAMENRGADEDDAVNRHIAQVWRKTISVSIDDIRAAESLDTSVQKRTDEAFLKFMKVYRGMIEQGSPEAICMICRKELADAGLDWEFEGALDIEQRSVCKRIMEFMKESKIDACIAGHPSALYLCLRITWMYYDGYPLDGWAEWKPTYFRPEEWQEGWQAIHDITQEYHDCAKQPNQLVDLLLALSTLQLSWDYKDAYMILRAMRAHWETKGDLSQKFWKRVPYLVCRFPGREGDIGKPMEYDGEVLGPVGSENTQNGWMDLRVDGSTVENVYFSARNLGQRHLPPAHTSFSKLSLGFSYAGTYTACNYQVVAQKSRKGEEG